MKKLLWPLPALALAALLAGCSGNPDNAPTEDAVKQANEARAKAIDEDTSLTPEGKQKMKEMLKLTPPSEGSGAQGR